LEIVRERVAEMRKGQEDSDWKQKLVDQYNKATSEEDQNQEPPETKSKAGSRPAHSVAGSAMSMQSYVSVARSKIGADDLDAKSKWDSSTRVGDGPVVTTEDKIAKLVAD
jgi:hypothetical protein